jgi:ATP-dependent RNA helicase DHX37/DHR1
MGGRVEEHSTTSRRIATEQMAAEDKRRLRHSYQCVLCEGPVYLQPSSPFSRSPPGYVVYQELVDTGSRVLMRGVMAVEEAWLPQMAPQLCTFSDPLEFPPPTFDPVTGTVRCHLTCTYGPHRWPLGSQETAHPPGLPLYRLFALFLLQGKVCPRLAQLSSSLLLPPVTMLKSWAKLHPQTEVLLKALVEREVASREALLWWWEREPKCESHCWQGGLPPPTVSPSLQIY